MILSLFLQGYNQRSAYIASQGESFPNKKYIITIYYVIPIRLIIQASKPEEHMFM